MCGICCFSMRFVVFIDLFSTVIQPASIVYLTYLIVMIIIDSTNGNVNIPIIALYLLAIVYGMQMVIFVFKRQFQHVLWMIIYLLAMPVFGFMLPLYSFWHMDDFSWGNTRIVMNGGKKQQVMEEFFDLNEIPHQKYTEYEADYQQTLNVPIHEEWQMEIQWILNNYDWQTLTKRKIRHILSERLGMDLEAHKQDINLLIDQMME